MYNVAIIQKPVNWFTLQIKWRFLLDGKNGPWWVKKTLKTKWCFKGIKINISLGGHWRKTEWLKKVALTGYLPRDCITRKNILLTRNLPKKLLLIYPRFIFLQDVKKKLNIKNGKYFYATPNGSHYEPYNCMEVTTNSLFGVLVFIFRTKRWPYLKIYIRLIVIVKVKCNLL